MITIARVKVTRATALATEIEMVFTKVLLGGGDPPGLESLESELGLPGLPGLGIAFFFWNIMDEESVRKKSKGKPQDQNDISKNACNDIARTCDLSKGGNRWCEKTCTVVASATRGLRCDWTHCRACRKRRWIRIKGSYRVGGLDFCRRFLAPRSGHRGYRWWY